eukprot:GGOE01054235.1.p1 GENE.GGOE01054235.1~~GGOE01054235.1.p1  ORF type:complete len:690 (+),score=192.00 GGOE01054235.1:232-2301(+)
MEKDSPLVSRGSRRRAALRKDPEERVGLIKRGRNDEEPPDEKKAQHGSGRTKVGPKSARPGRSRSRLARQFLTVTAPFFSTLNPQRWTAVLWLVTAVALLGGESLLLVWFSYAQKELTTAMSERNQDRFWKAVYSYARIVLVACPLFAMTEFSEANFVFRWRQWLTRHCMSHYWSGRCFYTLGRDDAIDHPDQRICEDVNHFTSRACSLLLKVAAKVVNVFSFVTVLWAISPTMVLFLLCYCATTTVLVTLVFGERLERLEVNLRVVEAEFRCAMMRGLEHAEEIAFFNGGAVELSTCLKQFAKVMGIAKQLINVGFFLHFLQFFIEYVTVLLPYIFIAERYFVGEMEFGVLSQTAMAFRVIQNGLNVIVKIIARLSALAAETERIHALLTTLEAEAEKEAAAVVQLPVGMPLDGEGSQRSAEGLITRVERTTGEESNDLVLNVTPPLAIENLTVLTPDRAFTLWRHLTITVNTGQSLLIMGPSGCGKSSLLRAIAGLFTAGAGRVELPVASRSFFMPQKPYIPTGSLRDQLLYGASATVPSKLDMEEHLRSVGLGALLGRVGGWDACDVDFASMLSLGEQQRVAVARLLCHGPSIAFLDECTSALDEKNEARIYGLIRVSVPCIVSVGHRRSLLSFHTHVLRCHGNGEWQLLTPADLDPPTIPSCTPLRNPLPDLASSPDPRRRHNSS